MPQSHKNVAASRSSNFVPAGLKAHFDTNLFKLHHYSGLPTGTCSSSSSDYWCSLGYFCVN